MYDVEGLSSNAVTFHRVVFLEAAAVAQLLRWPTVLILRGLEFKEINVSSIYSEMCFEKFLKSIRSLK